MFLIQLTVFQYRPPIGNWDCFGLIEIPHGECMKPETLIFLSCLVFSVATFGKYFDSFLSFSLHHHRVPHLVGWKGFRYL